MSFPWLQFIIILVIFVGVSVFLVKMFMFADTENAVKRLNDEIAQANAKQVELGRKIKEADADLEKRRAEARDMVEKLRTKADLETKQERDKIVADARKEGEDIIQKAKISSERMKKELEKEFELKTVRASMILLNKVLSEKAREAFNIILVEEFMEKLGTIDMAQIASDIKAAEIATVLPISKDYETKIAQLLKDKSGREIKLTSVVDKNLGGGIMLRFGSMALDGSVQNVIREVGTKMQDEIASRIN
ncbi:MAG: F0F1 ATP synthase subunit delta [Candidatus Omnitrophica bacterium]|nr:F0F1 ATP synthase subunit delta [Candidatus Omnitrophota bacterium]